MKRIISTIIASVLCIAVMTSCGSLSLHGQKANGNSTSVDDPTEGLLLETFPDSKSDDQELATATTAMPATIATDSVSDFLAELNNNNISSARKIYADNIAGDYVLENSVKEKLLSRLHEAVDSYNNSITSDNATSAIFDSISSLGILQDYEIDSIRYEYDLLVGSKIAYNTAEAYYDSDDFYNAYQQYLTVIPDDIKYSDARQKAALAADSYVSDVIEKANIFCENNDYSSAIITVRNALDLMPENQTLLTEKNVLEHEFVQLALDQAEETYQNNKDYEGALVYIREALTVVNDPSLNDALDYYTSCAPVPLTSLSYVQKGNCLAVGNNDASMVDSISKDVNGNVYDKNTVIHPYGRGLFDAPSITEQCYVLYNLNFEYSSLSGTVYRPYLTLSCKGTWENPTTVAIYGDDILLYEAPNVTKETYDTYDFSIDVSGVRNLKIVVYGTWSSAGEYFGTYYHIPKVCMADLFLQK